MSDAAEENPTIRPRIFTIQTGHRHPNLGISFGNYLELLVAMSIDAVEIAHRLEEAAKDAGYDSDDYRKLREQIIPDADPA